MKATFSSFLFFSFLSKRTGQHRVQSEGVNKINSDFIYRVKIMLCKAEEGS